MEASYNVRVRVKAIELSVGYMLHLYLIYAYIEWESEWEE
jgi:hypothetical protein